MSEKKNIKLISKTGFGKSLETPEPKPNFKRDMPELYRAMKFDQ